ncbi:hypothetical protein ACA910_022216 [Epithemia clementina (nom. ined.)]
MAKDETGGHHQQQKEEQSGDQEQSRAPGPIRQDPELTQLQQQLHSSQESAAAATLTQLQLERFLQAANAQTTTSAILNNHSTNSQSINPGSASALIPASVLMNFRHPGSTMEGTFGVSSAQRQLLSALLSEGLSSTRAPISLQSLEALQRISASDRSQALSTVNRALQEQLLMSELLRSPGAQRSSSQAVPVNLLENMPVSASLQGYLSQSPRLPSSYSSSQQRLAASLPAELGMLPPRAVDRLFSQPNTSANVSGSVSSFNTMGASLIGHAKGSEASAELSLKRGDDERGDQQKRASALPPRKRRKTVNFKLESSQPEVAVKALFPLPALTEEESATRKILDASNALLSYKNLWAKLGKAERGRKELFCRRLQKGKVPIVKSNN